MKYFLSLASLIVVGSFLAFLYNCIDGLALFSARIDPALEPWVFWILFAAVAGILGWFAAVALVRPKPMLVYADPTEADLIRFRRELLARLKRNRHLRDAEVVINDENDLATGLAVLKVQANEEIRATGKRIFITTAISQNGRLDTLVVLFLITRLTWRLAKLYNQRPHYREMLNLLANVGATAVIAGSIEELGIEEHVAELMGPLAGGSAIGAVPGAQAIAGTITQSVLTGSTNCLLALRCGVVARNYLALDLDAKGAMRRNATAEASRMFVTMSAETVTYVTKALVRGASGAVRSGSAKAVRTVGKTVSGTAQSVGEGARKVGDAAKSTAQSAGRGVKGAADAVGQGAKKVGDLTRSTADTVSRGVKDAAGAVGDTSKKTARSVGKGVKDAVESVGQGAKKVGGTTRSAADTVSRGVKETASAVGGTSRQAARKAGETVKDAASTVSGGVKKAGQSVKDAADSVTRNVRDTASGVKGTAKRLSEKAVENVRTSRGKLLHKVRGASEQSEDIKDKADSVSDEPVSDESVSEAKSGVRKVLGRFKAFRRKK
ncbi:DUF697 domain-containing protein [Pseudodesulfovibrio cashew]|nr:DUF697 domain-containing protein [Pseudodesulfovibrio cashew]